VGPSTEQYLLTISGYHGVNTDPFSIHPLDGIKFTTRERDNDQPGTVVSTVLLAIMIMGILVDGGTRLAHIYIQIMGTTTSIQHTSMINGILYHL